LREFTVETWRTVTAGKQAMCLTRS